MSQPFIGEIRMFGGNFAPVDWAFCNGQTMQISGNEALFTLIGTTYGGDGVSTFLLPNLQSRVPVGMGTGAGLPPIQIGQVAGNENITVSIVQIPNHNHLFTVNTAAGGSASPNGALLCGGTKMFKAAATNGNLAPTAVQSSGGSVPHNNIQPYQVVNYIIALYGVFPTRN
jgi:microcystin-dependent protein